MYIADFELIAVQKGHQIYLHMYTLGKTTRCWCVIHVTKATTLSVYSQLWMLYQQMVGNVKTVEYVLSVAHEQVVSGTIIVWYVTVVTNSKTTYLVLSVKNCASKTSRKICCIVTCAKGE
ncbi:hypothetical protein EK904_005598 [Melospiza melodia maxima]|nr:hypothetical protein EK904_005598 [Melospiza melodia maxima]